MKIFIFTIAIVFAFTGAASAQTMVECPHTDGCVVLSRTQAIEYLTYRDENTALKADAAVKDQAIADLQKLVNDVKIDLARISGEKTQLEADRVRWTAVIDILIKNSRAKKNGFINF